MKICHKYDHTENSIELQPLVSLKTFTKQIHSFVGNSNIDHPTNLVAKYTQRKKYIVSVLTCTAHKEETFTEALMVKQNTVEKPAS